MKLPGKRLKNFLNPVRILGLTPKKVREIARENREPARVIGLSIEDNSPIYEPNTTTSWVSYGGAGAGKSTCVTVPAVQSFLHDLLRCIVINDVKSGEVAHQIAEMCLKADRNFAVIDDSFVLGKTYPHRVRVNPFGNLVAAYLRNSPDLLQEIESAALTILAEPEGGLDKNFFFRQVPREFIFLGILILLSRHAALATPGGLTALLGDPETWNAMVDIEAAEGDDLTRNRARQIQELRDNDPEHYSQHYLAAMSALRLFAAGSPMHEAGREQDISHEQLLKENYVVCLVQNQNSAERLGVYYALHFNSFLSAQLTGECGKTDIIFDEAGNTPAKDLIGKVTIFRASKLRVLYIAQSRSDLQRRNGDKLIATLEDNCNMQWLQFGNFEEAERVSKAIGEIDNVNFNLGGSSDKPDFSTTYQTGRERLFTPDVLMNLPPNEQILHVAGVGWIHCLKIRQNEIAPSCFDLSDNPLEGGRLEPDVKVTLPANGGGAS